MSGPAGRPPEPLIVLDDDPTGTQTLWKAEVVCRMGPDVAAAIASAAGDGALSVHLLTNTRALAPADARRVTFEAARAAFSAVPRARIVLRGDSTLRGHVADEYLAYLDAIMGGAAIPLVLVPALPSAGRVTRGGQHLLLREGRAIPLEDTEYARDPAFGYSTGHLLDWAEERSGGVFRASRGELVPLDLLRAGGARAVVDAVARAASKHPAVVAIDAETEADLELVAAGIRAAPACCVRCAPALVGVLAGNVAPALVELRPVSPKTLVICGSWVPLAGRQLEALDRAYPGTSVEVDAARLMEDSGEAEVAQIAGACLSLLADRGVAVASTPRRFDSRFATPAAQGRLAERLAAVVREVGTAAGAVVAKGGITSAVAASVGLQATRAEVLGPVAPGVAVWNPLDGPMAGTPLAIVPGNVGDDQLIADVVERIQAAAREDVGHAGSVR
jgi:uncharacterized protein YgbK (DUF1537 family)